MEIEDKIGLGIITALILGGVSLFHGFGTRNIKEVYSFKYKEIPITLKRQNIRWGPDKYFFSINGKGRLTGELPTDEGHRIKTRHSWRQDNTRYSIRDADQQ